MEDGQNGQSGVNVMSIVETPETGHAMIPHHYLGVRTAAALTLRKRRVHIFAMEMTVAQVKGDFELNQHKLTLKTDSTDYIGCFKKKDGLDMYQIHPDTMPGLVWPCYCIGYCNSMNTSLVGVARTMSCICGDEPGTKVDESYCDQNCYGDNSLKCGGYNSTQRMEYYSVFGTGR